MEQKNIKGGINPSLIGLNQMTMREKITSKIATADITLDESIYPRENIDHKRVSIFADNLRDNFKFDPIEVQAPLSSERFNAITVDAMQGKKILGIITRYILLLKQKS